eukprot:Platyproteum_vivax@DN3111_c0_g1_i2.p2
MLHTPLLSTKDKGLLKQIFNQVEETLTSIIKAGLRGAAKEVKDLAKKQQEQGTTTVDVDLKKLIQEVTGVVSMLEVVAVVDENGDIKDVDLVDLKDPKRFEARFKATSSAKATSTKSSTKRTTREGTAAKGTPAAKPVSSKKAPQQQPADTKWHPRSQYKLKKPNFELEEDDDEDDED